MWTGRKKDKRATADVTATTKPERCGCGEQETHGRVLSWTLSRSCSQRADLHYSATLPWTDTGIRCTTAKYFAYHQQITQLQNEFERLVNDFLSAYQWK